MASQEEMILKVQKKLSTRSEKAMALAKQYVKEENINYAPLKEALTYFIEEVWVHVSHPALLSLCCETAGGNPADTQEVGAAFVLLAGAADIHDDIIDKSETKSGIQTVYGKYGADIAIVAGNILWIKGMLALSAACKKLSLEKATTVEQLTKQAFFDLGSAEAKEISHHGDLKMTPQNYLDVLNLKVAIAQATAKIGAIVGGANPHETERLGVYGRNLGLLMTLRDEYVDVFEVDELKNRYRNECLPLPVLYALQNPSLKRKILEILKNGISSEEELDAFTETVFNAEEVEALGVLMRGLVEEARNMALGNKEWENELVELIDFAVVGLPK